MLAGDAGAQASNCASPKTTQTEISVSKNVSGRKRSAGRLVGQRICALEMRMRLLDAYVNFVGLQLGANVVDSNGDRPERSPSRTKGNVYPFFWL